MSNDIVLDIQIPNLKEIKKKLGDYEKKAPTALKIAINKTLTETSKLMTKAVQENYTAKVKGIRGTYSITNAGVKTLSGKIVSRSNDRISLYEFKPSPKISSLNANPIKGRLRKDSSGANLSGSGDRSAAFVAQMKSGHIGIFERVLGKKATQYTDRVKQREKSRWAGLNDYKIAEMYGLPVPYMIGDKKSAKEIQKKASDFLRKTIDEEIEKIIARGIK